MKNKTEKIKCVENTLRVCKNMAYINKQREQNWIEEGDSNMSFTCHMLVDAYEFIAQLLENDLKDKE